MVVQHNLTAMNANRYLGINNSKLSKSLEKLSSGYAINRAGDNAAGLAVSEKMRSQIAGMTQGVKNAQDGISMVQTFEGALTETDSILQRMKTLADQAANGTYQDDVDRDAIQLEFDQLNDELNQIADTDFNGVVVLNGGQMADGTVAVDGKFDYSKGYTTAVVAHKATDISGTPGHTIVDQSAYTKEIADAVWSAVGADVNKNETLDVTFMYDGDRWMAQTVTDGNGKVVDGARASGLEARRVEKDGSTGNGGFEVIAGKDLYTGQDITATNAIFNEMVDVKRGDTVTIRFENSKEATYAPKNAGLDECYDGTKKAFKMDAGNDAASTLSADTLAGKVSFELSDKISDKAMNKTMKNVLTALDQMDIEANYKDGALEAGSVVISNGNITDTDAKAVFGDISVVDDSSIVYKAGTDEEIVLGSLKFDNIKTTKPEHSETTYEITTTTKQTVAGTATDSTDVAEFDAATKATVDKLMTAVDGKLKPKYTSLELRMNAGGTQAAVFGIDKEGNAEQVLANTAIATLGIAIQAGGNGNGFTGNTDKITVALKSTTEVVPEEKVDDANADGKFKFGVNIDAYNFADMSALSVHSVATPSAATMATQVAKDGVSVSNAHKNGSAPLTYTDNITLQTGARSKDAVNFTFKYSSGGMGNLKSNMNCSAREDGLNTASLSLKTAESANYAIDQIDNAINKVSMVRATFGAVQNRLEHKIDNMNVSIENLTSAESQIRDTNMPTEMMNFTKQQILAQASQSMLAQANQLPQSVLSLLQ